MTLLKNSESEFVKDSALINRWTLQKDWNGFNAKEVSISDLLVDGIIDPTLVTKSSVSAAFSIAMMFLTTEVAVKLE